MNDPKKHLDANVLQPKELTPVILLTLLFYFFGMIFAAAMVLFGWEKFALIAEVLFIIPAIIVVINKKMSFSKAFRFNAVNGEIILYTFLISFSVLILGDELDRLIGTFFPLPSWFDARALMGINTVWQGIVIIGNAVFVAAFAEEMLFRGMIQQTLESVRETAMAILLSTIFFALLHLNPWWMIQITLLGLVLGYMAWKSASIWPTIMVHGLNNLLAILSLNSSEQSLFWYATEKHVHWHWLVLAAVAVVPSFIGFQKACDKFHHKKDINIL